MKTELLKERYLKYNLTKDDVFKHQHYIIITRSGIDKIQALEKIHIDYINIIDRIHNICEQYDFLDIFEVRFALK